MLPGFVDFHATHNADLPWALLSAGPELPVQSVTFAQYARATHRIAHKLRPERAGKDKEVVAILINCDTILYLALIVGLVRAGLVPFPMSPRNSAPAIINMLKQTSSHRIISQPALSPLLSEVQNELEAEGYALQVDDLPGLDEVFPSVYDESLSDDYVPYPPSEEPYDPKETALYAHSSGSTGFPKPIPQRHENMLECCNSSIVKTAGDHKIVWGAMALPTFHMMAVYIQLYGPLVGGCPVGLFAPKWPASPVVPTPRNTLEACMTVGVNGIPTVPAFVEAWAKSEEDIKYLRTLKIIAFAGGPLSSKTGGRLQDAGVPLYPWYGGTEFGPHTKIFDIDESPDAPPNAKTRADWEWMAFTERVQPRWDPQGDGTYELQYVSCPTHRPNIENMEDGYATRDLWEPHPTKKGLWRITGRKDDVIVLGSGEKVVPIPQEGLIVSSPMVNGAVMFGRAKNQCGVLIEPAPSHTIDPNDPVALPKFRNMIWPIVEEANRTAPGFARLFKEMIIVTDPAKPLPRAAKGTVIRKQAIDLYKKEIADLYQIVEDSGNSSGIAPPEHWSVLDVEAWLLKQASAVAGGRAISPSVDVFDQGFDSLHATFLRNRIIAALRADPLTQAAAQHVSQNFVFEYPMLHDLAKAISMLIDKGGPDDKRDLEKSITELAAKYTANMPQPAHQSAQANGVAEREPVVLLTGSTGAVGSHILARLLADPRIAKVYTFNRQVNVSYDRQRASFVERELDLGLLDSPKLVSLVGDLSQQFFGLEEAAYNEIRDSVTHVLHNAWRVDFNLSLSTFESHVAGARSLVDFCCSLPHPVKLIFTSSISAVHKWNVSLGPVPEGTIPSPEVATSHGYGASKFVTEQVLAKAADNGLECTSVRLGQVCGPNTSGAWATTEWIPIMVKTSVGLGALPDLHGTVSWVPADAVASTYLDLVLYKERLPYVLHLTHPRSVKWRQVIQNIKTFLESHSLDILPVSEWTSRLEQQPMNGKTLDDFPALKILEYVRGMAAGDVLAAKAEKAQQPVEAGGLPVFSTARMQRYSATLRDLGAIDVVHARAWVSYWEKTGFLRLA